MSRIPRVRQPSSLENMCYSSVANNLSNYWCKDFVDNQLDKYAFRHVIGPFSSLPPPMLSRLLETVRAHRALVPSQLVLFLCPDLLRMNLSGRHGSVSAPMISTVSLNCSALVHLDLSGTGKLPLQPLLQLLGSQSNLEWLDLEGTSCGDRVMSVLGANCRKLRYLDVRHTRVSELGISALCINPIDDHADISETRQCAGRSLQVLRQEGCQISNTRVACVAILSQMTSLRELDHSKTADAVAWMAANMAELSSTAVASGSTADKKAGTRDWRLSLEVLHGDCFDVALTAVTRCPLLRRLSLVVTEGSPLLLVPHLTLLTELTLIYLLECGEQASKAVDLLLSKVCASLVKLELVYVGCLRVDGLMACRQLTSINLSMCTYTGSRQEEEKTANSCLSPSPVAFSCYEHLESLSMFTRDVEYPSDETQVPSSLFLSFITSRRIKYIRLCSCPEFSDDVIARLVPAPAAPQDRLNCSDPEHNCYSTVHDRCHSEMSRSDAFFSDLRTLHIQMCNNVSACSILRLVSACPRLVQVRMDECRRITLADTQHLQMYVNIMKWKVRLEWT